MMCWASSVSAHAFASPFTEISNGGGSIASGGDWQGASGYLPCSLGTDALLAALQMVAAGEVYVPVEMMADDSPITLRSQGWLTGR